MALSSQDLPARTLSPSEELLARSNMKLKKDLEAALAGRLTDQKVIQYMKEGLKICRGHMREHKIEHLYPGANPNIVEDRKSETDYSGYDRETIIYLQAQEARFKEENNQLRTYISLLENIARRTMPDFVPEKIFVQDQTAQRLFESYMQEPAPAPQTELLLGSKVGGPNG